MTSTGFRHAVLRTPVNFAELCVWIVAGLAVQCAPADDPLLRAVVASRATQGAIPAGCQEAVRNAETYLFCSYPVPFAEARDTCRASGMSLATIDDKEENAFVAAELAAPSYIGLTDDDAEGVWRWEADNRITWCGDGNGRPLDSVSYASWRSGHPQAPTCERRELGLAVLVVYGSKALG